MAKDKTEAELHERKEKKKDKKRKLDDADVEDGAVAEKKPKKDKKQKRESAPIPVEEASLMDIDGEPALKVETAEEEKKGPVAIPLAALVPFANPLADEKNQKKVLKSVKKAAKAKTLKRGVKECVKAIRKSPAANPSTSASDLPVGIVILAADISPMDVISHIPVLCEDHAIPYIYVPSRAELGAAGSTKRPTSVVMMTPEGGKKGEGGEEWMEAYKELHKLAIKLGQTVRV